MRISWKTLGLNLNSGKSIYMIFNSNKTKNKKLQTEDRWQDNLKIGQTILKPVQNKKYLGYIIKDNLKEDNRIDKIIYQMNQSIGIPRPHIRNVSPYVKCTIDQSQYKTIPNIWPWKYIYLTRTHLRTILILAHLAQSAQFYFLISHFN